MNYYISNHLTTRSKIGTLYYRIRYLYTSDIFCPLHLTYLNIQSISSRNIYVIYFVLMPEKDGKRLAKKHPG